VGQGPVPPAAPPAPAPRRGGHPARGGRGGRGNRGGAAARGGRRQNQAQRAGAEGGEFGLGLGPQGEGELDPRQEAWIRHFVQMALIDQEDDSDEEWPQH
ncbi:RWD domain-containing protein, partial [Colletotrichum sojae]